MCPMASVDLGRWGNRRQAPTAAAVLPQRRCSTQGQHPPLRRRSLPHHAATDASIFPPARGAAAAGGGPPSPRPGGRGRRPPAAGRHNQEGRRDRDRRIARQVKPGAAACRCLRLPLMPLPLSPLTGVCKCPMVLRRYRLASMQPASGYEVRVSLPGTVSARGWSRLLAPRGCRTLPTLCAGDLKTPCCTHHQLVLSDKLCSPLSP